MDGSGEDLSAEEELRAFVKNDRSSRVRRS